MSTSRSGRTKKVVAITAAVIVSAASLLVGTLAWQSLNQTATNILVGEVNPGGRLHDDYDGEADKNIFVENFGDQNIFARIKLSEILIVGDGLKEVAIDANGGFVDRNALGKYELLVGSKIEDTLVPQTYIYDPDEKNGADAWIEKVWGGQDWFMPTFDKNEKSIYADLNGSSNYVNAVGEVIPYGDFINWQEHTGISDKDTYRTANEAFADYTQSNEGIIFDEYTYDDNTGNIIDEDNSTGDYSNEENGDKNGYYVASNQTHYPDQTLAAASVPVITMNEWLARKSAYDTYVEDEENDSAAYEGDPVTGAFWVYDSTTEYFYWAQPIPPYENVYTKSEENLQNTTGLLINELKKTGRLDQDHYYELIVDADFVTVDDLLFTNTDTGRGFHTSDEGITSGYIQTFLKTIGAASDEDTFTYVLDIAVDEHYVPYGSKIQLTGFDGQFEKVAITGDNGTIQDSEYTVLKEDETVALSSQITDKKLTMYVYYDGGRYNKITIYLGSNVQ